MRRTLIALWCAVALPPLAACGGGASGGSATTTITITPTVIVTPGDGPTTSKPPAVKVVSDDKGRKYDFGTITRIDLVGSTRVMVFDRWGHPHIGDGRLALRGVPIRAYKDMPFSNINTSSLYRIPVTPDAVLIQHHCVAVGDPWQTKSATLAEFARLPEADRIMLVTLDERGYAVKAETLPRCP